MTRDEAVKLVGVLKRTAISFHESRTDDALIRALDAEDALVAALTAPAAGEDVEFRSALEAALAKHYGFVSADVVGLVLSRLRAVPQGWRDIETDPPPENLREKLWFQPAQKSGRSVLPQRTVVDWGIPSSSRPTTHWQYAPDAPAPEKGEG
jgi:hypothetical protein